MPIFLYFDATLFRDSLGNKKCAFAQRFFKKSGFGGTSVTKLEPIYIIADWFLNDNNWNAIKLPKVSVDERRQQILEMNYVF